MSENSFDAVSVYADAELAKDLRDTSRLFVRLDFAYLAAGGAIATALKLSGDEIMEVTSGMWVVAAAYLFLMLTDCALADFFSGSGLRLKRELAQECQ